MNTSARESNMKNIVIRGIVNLPAAETAGYPEKARRRNCPAV
jgi:hypothetical protein